MKAVILAGGMGTRFSKETSASPMPMIEDRGKPILWRILSRPCKTLTLQRRAGFLRSEDAFPVDVDRSPRWKARGTRCDYSPEEGREQELQEG